MEMTMHFLQVEKQWQQIILQKALDGNDQNDNSLKSMYKEFLDKYAPKGHAYRNLTDHR